MKNKLIKGTPEWEAYWIPIIEKRKKTCIQKYGYFTSFSNPATQDKVKATLLQKYGVDNIFKSKEKQRELQEKKLIKYNNDLTPIFDKAKNTLKSKYGVENISQIPEVKQKKKEAALLKYGVDNVFKSEEIKSKIKQTNISKYGVEHNSQCEAIKEKQKIHNEMKYGYKYTSQVPEIREKMETTLIQNGGIGNARPSTLEKYKNTSLTRYGTEYATQSIEIKEKIKQTCLEKYGVTWHCLTKECKLKGNNSKPNQKFAELLDNENIPYEREFYLQGFSYDFKIDNYLIEIDPWWTHNSSIKNQWDQCTEPTYHYNKSLIAFNNSFKCIHVFDWINQDKLINSIKNKTLDISDFRGIKCYKYNVKTKSVVEGSTAEIDEVLIYDGGQDLIW